MTQTERWRSTVEVFDEWSVAHPVALNPDNRKLPVYISLDDAVERCADAFAMGVPSRDWIRGWLSSGQALAGMRLIKQRMETER